MKIYKNAAQTIGHTPLIELAYLAKGLPGRVAVKQESRNPLGSIKDRPALFMLEHAEQSGRLTPGQSHLVEPTSGNTGIALAYLCAIKGYRLTLTMPDSMSAERRSLLKTLGAQVILTPGNRGMSAAIERAADFAREGAILLDQFSNMANPKAHRETTGPEIWEDTEGSIDIFTAGVGTGGTITGVGEFLKSQRSSITIAAVEPFESAVLSGEKPGPHKIQGIGAGFIPPILNTKLLDEIICIRSEAARTTAQQLATREGILCGISSGANVCAALQLAARPENKDKLIVTIICDTGERYLSTGLFSA